MNVYMQPMLSFIDKKKEKEKKTGRLCDCKYEYSS